MKTHRGARSEERRSSDRHRGRRPRNSRRHRATLRGPRNEDGESGVRARRCRRAIPFDGGAMRRNEAQEFRPLRGRCRSEDRRSLRSWPSPVIGRVAFSRQLARRARRDLAHPHGLKKNAGTVCRVDPLPLPRSTRRLPLADVRFRRTAGSAHIHAFPGPPWLHLPNPEPAAGPPPGALGFAPRQPRWIGRRSGPAGARPPGFRPCTRCGRFMATTCTWCGGARPADPPCGDALVTRIPRTAVARSRPLTVSRCCWRIPSPERWAGLTQVGAGPWCGWSKRPPARWLRRPGLPRRGSGR